MKNESVFSNKIASSMPNLTDIQRAIRMSMVIQEDMVDGWVPPDPADMSPVEAALYILAQEVLRLNPHAMIPEPDIANKAILIQNGIGDGYSGSCGFTAPFVSLEAALKESPFDDAAIVLWDNGTITKLFRGNRLKWVKVQ